jgi:hypothetical protein
MDDPAAAGTDETSIPSENTRNGRIMNGVMRRKAGTKTFPWEAAAVNQTPPIPPPNTLEYFIPFAANPAPPPPPQDEDIPAAKRLWLVTSSSMAADIGLGFLAAVAHTRETVTTTTASPSDIADDVPRDVVTVSPPLPRRSWNSDDDIKLTEAVRMCGNDWVVVAALVPGRTNVQCRERWANRLDPNINQKMGKWRAEETTWTMRYGELQLYNATQGDCLVPQKCKEYPRLGGWVNLQRVEYRKRRQGKKTSQMTEERMKKLNKLGFVWDMYEAAWTERYEELVKYKEKYGDCIVPRLHKEYPKLGEWVKNQKIGYRKKSRRMTESRIADLGVLGFVWEGQRHLCRDVYEAAWTERYEELVLYKGKYGDCIVPRLYKEYPKLGEWVSTQRKLYRGKSLPEINHRVRFDKLEALGFAWTAAVGKGSCRKDKDGR